uniref:DM domain-containing protein n=1 Tax=Labrus bergylta TaxID=56723 RepID=A0A3Q3G624_9LABR
MSKEQVSKEQVSKEQMSRQPKCSRCRHHGIIVPQKGHTKLCPLLKCDCWKCCLVAERTRIQRGLKKVKNGEQHPRVDSTLSVKKPAAKKTPCAASGTSGHLCPTSGGVPVLERDTNNNPSTPLDLRSRPAEGRQSVAGLESRNGLPFASGEGESCTPFSKLIIIETYFFCINTDLKSYICCIGCTLTRCNNADMILNSCGVHFTVLISSNLLCLRDLNTCLYSLADDSVHPSDPVLIYCCSLIFITRVSELYKD